MNITTKQKEICRLKQKYITLGGIIMANITENKNVQSVDYNAIEAMESFNKFVKKEKYLPFLYHCRVFISLYLTANPCFPTCTTTTSCW